MLIGLSGKIGSGKTTSSSIIKPILIELGYQVQEISFGYRLKEVVATLCHTPLEIQLSHSGKNTVDPVLGLTYGILQQKIGTGLRSCVDPDIWVRLALNSIPENTIGIVEDLRFPNEAQAILEKGGILIRMEGDPMGERVKSTRDLTHISETALDNWTQWDLRIDNSVPDLVGLHTILENFLRNDPRLIRC